MASYEKGDTDEDVAKIQTALGLAADGTFGPTTTAAVKAWQQARGVKADGMVGPDMLIALELPDLVILEKWDEGELVRRVQHTLGLEMDGVYGDQTIKAVRAWQKSHGLKANGNANEATLAEMGLMSGESDYGGEPVAPQSSIEAARVPAAQPTVPAPVAVAAAASAAASRPAASAPPANPDKSWWPFGRSVPASAPVGGIRPSGSDPIARPAIASWAYQIADVDADAIAALNVDLAVIDYARDGDEDSAFKSADLARMKQRPDGGTKFVVSYMSIGEAEDYRYYWQDAWKKKASRPAWLDALNPAWKGNYKVRYWDPEWKALILGNPEAYLDKIIAAGFDGVYLDIIDAFEYWRDDKAERPTADQDMIAFVTEIAAYARARRPGFLIIPQNGEALLDNPTYQAVISVQAKEDIFYGADGDGTANKKGQVSECLDHLAQARAAGIPIIAVEYLDDDTVRTSARSQLANSGCVAYFGPRALNTIPTDQFTT